jgi:transcriptional regulator with XRE-family HTH domain
VTLIREDEQSLPGGGTAATSCIRLLASGRSGHGMWPQLAEEGDLEDYLVTPWRTGYSTGSKFVILMDVSVVSSPIVTSPLVVDATVLPAVLVPPELEPVPTAVARVRTALGLNVSELARVLGVERQTVYSWLRGQSQPHKGNLKRLYALSRLVQAQVGRQLDRQAIRTPGEDGRSLFDLLSDELLEEGAIAQRLQLIAHVTQTPDERRPQSWLKTAAERHGVNMVEERGEFDRFTGKRLGSED